MPGFIKTHFIAIWTNKAEINRSFCNKNVNTIRFCFYLWIGLKNLNFVQSIKFNELVSIWKTFSLCFMWADENERAHIKLCCAIRKINKIKNYSNVEKFIALVSYFDTFDVVCISHTHVHTAGGLNLVKIPTRLNKLKFILWLNKKQNWWPACMRVQDRRIFLGSIKLWRLWKQYRS